MGRLRLRKITPDCDPSGKAGALGFVEERNQAEELTTGLPYLDPWPHDLHANVITVQMLLIRPGEADLCPGNAAPDQVNAAFRCRSGVASGSRAGFDAGNRPMLSSF